MTTLLFQFSLTVFSVDVAVNFFQQKSSKNQLLVGRDKNRAKRQ